MFRRLSKSLLLLFFQIPICVYAQNSCFPGFIEKTSESESITLNNYIVSKFQSDFFKYFGSICNQYYDVIKFNVNKNGNVIDIRYGSTNPEIKKFINDALTSTNGKWRLVNCGETIISKEIEMPVYFMFTDPCGTIMKTIYYSDTIPQSIMPLSIDGLTIQSITENKITLWPIKFMGPFIQKNSFIKD